MSAEMEVRYWYCIVCWYHYRERNLVYIQEILLEDSREDNKLFPIAPFFERLKKQDYFVYKLRCDPSLMQKSIINKNEADDHRDSNSWKGLTIKISDD